MADKHKAEKDKESLEGLRDEAVRRQDNLASDIDELVDRLNPKNAAERWKNEAVQVVKGFFVADDGTPDLPHVAVVAGGVIGVISLAVGAAAITHRLRG